MDIQMKLDLSRYTADEIISLIEDGLVTTQEVRDSGVIPTFFDDKLDKFILKYEEEKCQAENIKST